MKKYLLLILVTCIGIVSSCQYDDDELWGSVDDLANRVSALETLTQQMNGDIAALQAVITAVENRVAISEVEKLTDGYILHFTNGTTATIKHGKDGADGKDGQDGTDGSDGKDGAAGADGEDGKDGADGADGKDGKDGKDAPYIYIAKDNGVYYWTLTVDGKTDWLTDEAGNKIPVTGAAGADGEDGKDGADGTAGSAGTAGTPGTAGAPGRTPSLRITAQGEWEVSYDGQTWTAVPGAANALAQKGDAGAPSIFGEVEATEGAVTINMADGRVYTLLRLKSLEFYTDAKRTQAVSPKELTWNKDFKTVEYYFNLNLNDAKCEVMTEDGFEAEVSMEKNKVTVTLPQGQNPVQARAVILFYNNQQTLTSVFKFKHFEVDPAGNIAAVNDVLDMLGTTEELNVQIPALNTSGEDSNHGEVILPVIQGATQEGAGTNLTLNFTDEVTTSPAKPLVIRQVENTTTPDENLESGASIHNVIANFEQPVANLEFQTPNSSVTLTGGQTLTDVTALTGENTLYVDSVDLVNLSVKGGSVHIFPEGKITGNIKNATDPQRTIKIYLEPGATVEDNLPKSFDAEKDGFEIVYVSHKIVIKNKELAHALSGLFPDSVTITKAGYAEFSESFANSQSVLNFNGMGYTIPSLEGIEVFQKLRNLYCYDVKLATCDLSQNKELVMVDLTMNNLQSLDLSQNTKLEEIRCDVNPNLTKLDLSGCTSLQRLTVQNCDLLSSLEIPEPTKLTALMYGHTQVSFTKSQLEQFTNLNVLGCAGRYSDTGVLDIPQEMKARLYTLQCQNNNLTSLDLTEYPKLTSLECYWNNLTELNVAAAPDLVVLRCFSNRMTKLNVSSLPNLGTLDCGNQQDGRIISVVMSSTGFNKWNSNWYQSDFNQGVEVTVRTATALSNSIIAAQQDPSVAERIFVYQWASAARISGENSTFLSNGRYSDGYNELYHNTYLTSWIADATMCVELAENGVGFDKNLEAFARIWRAALIAEYSDNFGPYPLAGFQGSNTYYNSVQEVYYYILDELKEAVTDINLNIIASADDAALDPMFGFDAQRWARYGNSLRLRFAMRLSEVDRTKAQSEFEAVDKNMLIKTMADIAKVKERNTWDSWAGVYSRSWNYITLPSTMSNILVGLGGVSVAEQRPDLAPYTKPMDYLGMQFADHYAQSTDNPTKSFWLDGIPENLDPRALRIYCIPGDLAADNFMDYGSSDIRNTTQPLNDDDGQKILDLQGQYTWNCYPAGSRGTWSPNFAKNYAVSSWYDSMLPVLSRTYGGNSEGERVWFGPWETHFLLAEAALYGWNVGTSAQAAYEQGIRTSFENFGVSKYVEAYLQSEAYNRIGVSVKFTHTAEPTGFTAKCVNGYTNQEATLTYEYPNVGKALYKEGLNTQLAKIITQKYIAQTPYGVLEMWNDRRRLGLPWFDIPNNDMNMTGADMENTWSPTSYLSGQTVDVFPQRLRYPQSLQNLDNALQMLGGENTTITPLWWAIGNTDGGSSTPVTGGTSSGQDFGNGGNF